MNPSPPPVPANSPATASAVLSGAASGCPSGCLTTGCLLGIGLLGGGLLLLLAVPPLGLFGVILGTIVLGATAWAWLSRQQSETLDVALSCAPLRPCLGQEVAFAVTLTGKKSCRLGAGTVTLRCRERAISRGGTSDTTYTHTVYEDTRDLPSVDQLDAGSSWTAEVALPVPRELPASFSGRNNFIEWTVHLHITIPGPRLDITREQELQVQPALWLGDNDAS